MTAAKFKHCFRFKKNNKATHYTEGQQYKFKHYQKNGRVSRSKEDSQLMRKLCLPDKK